jgi:flagellar hook assembly protein FlgD
MIDYNNIISGLEVYYANIQFTHRSFRPTIRTQPTKCKIISVEDKISSWKGNYKELKVEIYNKKGAVKKTLYLEIEENSMKNEKSWNGFFFEDKEEANKWYNSQILKQLDRLQNLYETTKKDLEKKMV